MDRTNHRRFTILICALLFGLTLAVFWPVTRHEFINYDDPDYVTQNPHVLGGLTWKNLAWAFQSNDGANANPWHPLTWISHILDVQLFGPKPGGPHAVNLLFHTANTLLLFLLLQRLTGARWRSAFVAALFALHPLHVESVAWIAERKDVLSAFFFMLTLLAYERYARGKVRGQPHATFWYLLALGLFAMGLLSKPMLVTLPCVLLLLDFWPLQRLEFRINKAGLRALAPLLMEKVPFFVLSLLSSLLTLWAQRNALSNLTNVPPAYRLGNAALAYANYLKQCFWPTDLTVFYPLAVRLSEVGVVLAVSLLLMVTIVSLALIRRQPYLLVGWLWYLGMLVPVIGLVQVGAQSRADHYTYLPLIGIFMLTIWGAGAWFAAQGCCRSNSAKRLLAAGAGLLLLGLGFIAHRQVRYWRNNESLFAHAAQVTERNFVALDNLGTVHLQQGDLAGATAFFTQGLDCASSPQTAATIRFHLAVALQAQGKGIQALPYLQEAAPGSSVLPERTYRLSLSLIEAGRLPEAEAAIKEALATEPDNPDFQFGKALLLHRQGQTVQAEQLARNIAAAHPDQATVRRSFADFLLMTGRAAEAEAHYAADLKLMAPGVELRRAYAAALGRQGKTDAAIRQLKEALRQAPNDLQANLDLAELLAASGRGQEAVVRYDHAIKIDSSEAGALNNLAWLLATAPDDRLRDGRRAVDLAERACQLTEWKKAIFMGTLAAAYSEAGRFADAVTMAGKARDQARADKQDAIASKNQELLDLYRSGKPFREKQ